MRLKATLIIGLVGGTLTANAQSITPEVIATAGEHYNNGTTQLSWTMGEVMIDTYSSTDNILTQGFHQTELTATSIDERNPFSLDVNVFPNPTSQFLNVNVTGDHEPLTVTLYDLHGKLILQERLMKDQSNSTLDLSSLAMAYYMLTINDDEGGYSSTHKVGKSGGN